MWVIRWGCSPSKFPWTYTAKETCYLLEGKVKVYPDGYAECVEFGAGDLVEFPKVNPMSGRGGSSVLEVNRLADRLKNRLTPGGEVYRPVNMSAAKSTTIRAWNTKGPVNAMDLENGFIIFRFTVEAEMIRVLHHQPWSFNGHPLLMRLWSPDIIVKELKLCTLPIWMQVHGIPPEYITEEVGAIIANRVGELIEVDIPKYGVERGQFLRVRVQINIEDALRPCVVLGLATTESVIFPATSEKLPTGGGDREGAGSSLISAEIFGPWLRAERFHFASWPLNHSLTLHVEPLPSTTDTARGVLAGEGRVSATKEDDVFETEHGIATGEDNGDDEPSIEDEETSVQQVDGTRSFEDVCTALGSCNDRGTRGEQVGVCQDVDMTRSPRIRDAPDGSREMPPDSKRRLTGTDHFSLHATDAWNPQNALPQTHNPSDPGHVNIVMGSGTDHFDECYKPILETSSKPSIVRALTLGSKSNSPKYKSYGPKPISPNYSSYGQPKHSKTSSSQPKILSSLSSPQNTSRMPNSEEAPEGITEIINPIRAKVSAERNAELCNQFLGYLNSSNEEMQNCAVPGQQPWSAPERGWLKANVDGVALLNGSASGAGMVVRDSNGNMIFRGCKPLWGGGSRIAEVEAIRWSLLLALERGWSKLCIESDSKEAIDFLNGVAPSPHWDCNSLLEDISQLKGRCDQVLFLFTPRQANFEAHEATQEALIQSIGIRVSYPTTRDHVRRLSFDPGLSNE
ncbi:hypothetical protein HHK36_007707 [Tetracentron sinense]|uniref:RNase H type-1 domain-containing protein n=1 Tax=Tetracentron sinense TaxID=13715 RepID=A0A835DJB8_TETSI|nr:hypothetical protein HHK36_007707 [Tetracentron sinense]